MGPIQVVLAVKLLLAKQAVVRGEFRVSKYTFALRCDKGSRTSINRYLESVGNGRATKGLILHQRLEHLKCRLFYTCHFQSMSGGFGPQSQSTGNSFAYIMTTFLTHLKRHLTWLDLSASSAEPSGGRCALVAVPSAVPISV